MSELNPLMTGTAAVALASAMLAKQIEWGQITPAQARDAVQHALGMIAPAQRAEMETVYRAALPGLF